MKSEKAAKAKVAKAQEAKVAKKQADAEPTGTKTEPVIVSFRVALTSMSIADFDSAKADKFKVSWESLASSTTSINPVPTWVPTLVVLFPLPPDEHVPSQPTDQPPNHLTTQPPTRATWRRSWACSLPQSTSRRRRGASTWM